MPLIDVSTGSVIREIEKRPVIWDPSHILYKTKHARQNAWHEVFCSLIPEFESLSSGQRRETDRAIQQRWKTARDAYMRCKAQLRNGTCKKKYFYYPKLLFLERVYDSNADVYASDPLPDDKDDTTDANDIATSTSSEINIKDEPESNESDNCDESILQLQDLRASQNEDNRITASPPPTPAPAPSRTRKVLAKRRLKVPIEVPLRTKRVKVPIEGTKKIKVPIEVPQRTKKPLVLEIPSKKVENDNMSFFMSMLPIVDKFTDHQKLLFRSEVIKVAMAITSDVEVETKDHIY